MFEGITIPITMVFRAQPLTPSPQGLLTLPGLMVVHGGALCVVFPSHVLGFFQGGRPLQAGGRGATDREIKTARPKGW